MLLVSDEFRSALDDYDRQLKDVVLQKVRLLAENPAHPGLNVHRIRHSDKWECYVTIHHRIIYDRQEGALRLWKLGDHRLIDRIRHASFAAHTPFSRPDWDGSEQDPPAAGAPIGGGAPAGAGMAGEVEPGGSANAFVHFPATYLRLLGVPAGLIRAVRRAPSAEAIEQIDGLPPSTARWLLELLTNPELEQVVYDPSRLLYRTTFDRLEGYCRGSIRQLMLNLTPDQEQYVTPARSGIAVLKGVAGSGKTTVGIYRAIERAGAGRRVLLLTYNRTLNAVTRSLIESLIGPLPENLQVVNIDRWIADFLAERGVWPAVLEEADAFAVLRAALAEVRAEGREAVLHQRDEWFRDEIARVIKGAGLTTLAQYLAAERYGRRTALAPEQRQAVWRLYEAYQARLAREGLLDWRDPARLAYEQLLEQPLARPYDDLIIDEGQDLTALQLRIAQRLIRGAPAPDRSLLLLGDAAQTIYSRGFAWQTAGIQARGHTFTLRKNHRNTRQIAQSAAALLSRNQLLRASAEFIDPQWTERQGPWPLILSCDTAERELRAVRERLVDLVADQRFRVSDFAVICPTNELCEAVRQHLAAADLPCVLHRDEEFNVLEEQVKVLTIHAAKGLEFPVVFVVGVREAVLPHHPPARLDPEERAFELERQRTLLYVAMTRAAEALFLVTTGQARSRFLDELGLHVRLEPYPDAGRGG